MGEAEKIAQLDDAVQDHLTRLQKDKAAMAEKRAALLRIAVEEADSGALSEDEERERSEWPQ